MSSGSRPNPRRLLSVTSAAERLDCSRGHVYGLIATGQLQAVEIKTKGSTRSKTRVLEEDLEAFIDAATRRAPLAVVSDTG